MGVQEFYERMYGDNRPNPPKPSLYTSFLNRLLARWGWDRYQMTYRLLPGGESVLDIGCGDDLARIPLREKYQQVYGMDISRPRIDRMQKQFGHDPNIHLIVGDVNDRLSFADASFDAVVAIAIMEHAFDPYHITRESYRLLKRGGCFIVCVPNVALLGNRIRLLLGRCPVTSGEEGWDG
jgi:SAM-dependent methyltransferase